MAQWAGAAPFNDIQATATAASAAKIRRHAANAIALLKNEVTDGPNAAGSILLPLLAVAIASEPISGIQG